MSSSEENIPRRSPRELIPDGQWWSVEVVGKMTEMAVHVTFEVWSTYDRSEAEDAIFGHLEEKTMRKVATYSRESEDIEEITYAQVYGIDTPETRDIAVEHAEPLDAATVRILGQVADMGNVRLRSIRTDI